MKIRVLSELGDGLGLTFALTHDYTGKILIGALLVL